MWVPFLLRAHGENCVLLRVRLFFLGPPEQKNPLQKGTPQPQQTGAAKTSTPRSKTKRVLHRQHKYKTCLHTRGNKESTPHTRSKHAPTTKKTTRLKAAGLSMLLVRSLAHLLLAVLEHRQQKGTQRKKTLVSVEGFSSRASTSYNLQAARKFEKNPTNICKQNVL